MAVLSKLRAQEIAETLRLSGQAEAKLIAELARILADEALRQLVSAGPSDEIYRLQGEVRALERLHTRLTTAPTPIRTGD